MKSNSIFSPLVHRGLLGPTIQKVCTTNYIRFVGLPTKSTISMDGWPATPRNRFVGGSLGASRNQFVAPYK